MIITIPLIAADGATNTVTLPDPAINQPVTGNLLQSPNDFTNSVWTKIGATVTANSIIEDKSNGKHRVVQTFPNSGINTYTITCNLSPQGRSGYIYLQDRAGGNGAQCSFILVPPGNTLGIGTWGTGFFVTSVVIGTMSGPTAPLSVSMTVISNSAAVLELDIGLVDATNTDVYTGIGGIGMGVSGLSLTVPAPLPVVSGTFFVAANGNDNNPGTQTAPWRTIAKLNSVVFAAGSSISFRGGDTFVGHYVVAGNGNSTSSVTLGSYGTGRATLVYDAPTVAQAGHVIDIVNQSGVTVQDLNIRGGDLAHMPMSCIHVSNNSGVVRTNITIQRCDISGIHFFQATAPSAQQQGGNGFGIFFQGYPGVGVVGIEINNVIIHDCDAGIGGYGNNTLAAPPFQGHMKNVTIFNIDGGPAGLNPGLAFPPMGDGFGLDGWNNTLVEFCTAHDCGANYRNQGGGPAGFLTANCMGVKFSRCLAYNIMPSDMLLEMVDFIGFDIDNHSSGCTIDSCYAHDCYGGGFLLFDGTAEGGAAWNNNTITNCIAQNNIRSGFSGEGDLAVVVHGNPTITIQNNTTFNNRVFNGDLYAGAGNKAAPGLVMGADGLPLGTISKNIQITGIDVYGTANLLNARTNSTAPFTPPVVISNNAWFARSGQFVIWWGGTMYGSCNADYTICPTPAATVAQWQAGSGKGAGTQTGDPHFTAVGQGPAGYVQTTYPGWGATPQTSYGSA